MKVLLLDLGKNLRGGQKQVLYLARRLAQSPTHSPLAVVPKGAPLHTLLEESDIPVISLPSASDLNPFTFFRLYRTIARECPDIVHTNDAKGASLAALAKKWLDNFKLVHSRRVSYPLKSGWSRRKYELGDAVVGVSGEIEEVLIQSGISKNKTNTIHSGINADLYSPDKPTHPLLTIGAIGALTTQKGFEVLITALGKLDKQSMPPWQCSIAGDGPLLSELIGLAETLGLKDSISFLGYQDSRNVLPLMDILVIPSVDGEGSNAVIKEGWVTGTPVITSDLVSNLELVTHQHDGLVFPNRDSEQLARAVERLVKNPSLAKTLAANGLQTVTRFTDQAMAERYMQLYAELLRTP